MTSEDLKKSKMKTNVGSRGGLGDTLRTILYAVLIALGVRTFAYEPFNIPSGSMIPTLLVGDYLFVSKFSYGYSRYSFPMGLAPIEGRIFDSAPERGDVAVFKLPRDNSTDYIKRVVGLPGDEVQMREGILHINGEPVELEFVRDVRVGPATYREYRETLPGGHSHLIHERTRSGLYDNTPVYRVPEGHYFMMGDNRDASQDSRALAQVGYVPHENLVGRAEVLFFSTDGSARFWEVWRWPAAVRFERIFDAIR